MPMTMWWTPAWLYSWIRAATWLGEPAMGMPVPGRTVNVGDAGFEIFLSGGAGSERSGCTYGDGAWCGGKFGQVTCAGADGSR